MLSVIREQIITVIEAEGPIVEDLLRRKIIKAWGFSRAGDSIHSIITSAMPKSPNVTKHGDITVFWPQNTHSQEYLFYRVPAESETRRNVDEIPPEELANVMHAVLVDFQSCGQERLYRETVKILGFASLTAKMRKTLDIWFQVMSQSQRIE